MRQNLLKLFLEDESGVTVIEIVLILVVNLAPSLETAWILGVTTASCMHLGHFIY